MCVRERAHVRERERIKKKRWMDVLKRKGGRILRKGRSTSAHQEKPLKHTRLVTLTGYNALKHDGENINM